jgi:hypothetical protein
MPKETRSAGAVNLDVGNSTQPGLEAVAQGAQVLGTRRELGAGQLAGEPEAGHRR